MHSHRVRLALAALGLLAGMSGPLLAQEEAIRPGDRVEVVGGPAPVQSGDRTLARVEAGTRLTALKVQDPYVRVGVETGGRVVHGWIHRRHLRRVREVEAEPMPFVPADEADAEPDRPPSADAEGSEYPDVLLRLAVMVAFSLVISFLLYLAVASIGSEGQRRPPRDYQRPKGEEPPPPPSRRR